MITIAAESPLTADGRALIAASQLHLESVFPPDGIFTLTAEELDAQADAFLVAREDGHALGCVALVSADDYAEVKRLMVLEEARGKGVARLLMAAFEQAARDRGLLRAMIETGPELGPAVALYTALGYHERGPFGEYGPHPSSLFMEKRLIRSGHCLCGRVRYRAHGPVLRAAHCHCESCRRATSSPMTSFFDIADGGWEWVGDAPVAFASSPHVTRFFCGTCGSPMGYRHDVEAAGEMHFYAATLDDPAEYRPEGHDFWAEHLEWLHLSDGLPR